MQVGTDVAFISPPAFKGACSTLKDNQHVRKLLLGQSDLTSAAESSVLIWGVEGEGQEAKSLTRKLLRQST